MHMEPGPLHQLLLHLGVFMGTVVINNQMNIQVIGYIPSNVLEEGDKLPVAAPMLALGQHLAGRYIQGSKQGCGAVTNIIMGHTFHIPSPKGGMGWVLSSAWINVMHLIHKEGVIGNLEMPVAMGPR